MDQGYRRRGVLKARLGMCLIATIGLPAFVLGQTVPGVNLKLPVEATPARTMADPREDDGFLAKLRALRAVNGGYPRPTASATTGGSANPIVEPQRGFLARLRPQPLAPIAPPAPNAKPNPGHLTLDEMYKYAAGLASPAELVATKIKADEGGSKSRLAAVQYLGSVDFRHYPEAENALLAALRADRSETVRYEVIEAFARGQGLSATALEALKLTAMGSERDGNPSEPSERVRAAALVALQKHWQGGRPDLPGTAPQRLPQISKALPAPQSGTQTGPKTSSVTQAKAETPSADVPAKRATPTSALLMPKLLFARGEPETKPTPPPVTKAKDSKPIETKPGAPTPTAAATAESKSAKQESSTPRWKGTPTGLDDSEKRKLRDDGLRDDALREFAEKVGTGPIRETPKTPGRFFILPSLFGAKTEPQREIAAEKPATASVPQPVAPQPLTGPASTSPAPVGSATPAFVPPQPLPTVGGSAPLDRPLSSYRLEPIGSPGSGLK